MRRRASLRAIGTGATVAMAGLAGCGAQDLSPAGGGEGGGNQTPPANGGTTQPSREVPNEVSKVTEGSDYLFDPVGLFVASGETITWSNESGAHSSTAYATDNPQSAARRIPEDADAWDSGILTEQGATFTHTFEVRGTYDYYCTPHTTLGR